MATTHVQQPLRLDYFRDAGSVGVRVIGEVDVSVSPILREALVELIEAQGNLSVVLDLSAMTFIDSTGVGVLVGALRALKGKGGSLVLAEPQRPTMRILEIAGLVDIFEIRSSDSEAARG